MTSAVFLSIPLSMPRQIKGHDYGHIVRQEVINRWSLCVDHVISVNCPRESEELAGQMSGVELVKVTGPVQVGISDIAKIYSLRGYATIAISNADCIPIDVKLIREIVRSTKPNSAHFLRRANINADELNASHAVFHGIDTFILSCQAVAAIPQQTRWAIGQPVWDIWLALLLMVSNIEISGLGANLIAHFDHPQKWNDREWLVNARQLLSEIPLNAIENFGKASNKFGAYDQTWPDKAVRRTFDWFAEVLYSMENPRTVLDDSFDKLWLQVLKRNFGPDDDQFSDYVSFSGRPVRRWLIKNGLFRSGCFLTGRGKRSN